MFQGVKNNKLRGMLRFLGLLVRLSHQFGGERPLKVSIWFLEPLGELEMLEQQIKVLDRK